MSFPDSCYFTNVIYLVLFLKHFWYNLNKTIWSFEYPIMAVLLVEKDFLSPSVEFEACIVYVCKPNLQSFVYIYYA